MNCPACGRQWNDLDRHLAFSHSEIVLLTLDPPWHPAPQPEPLWPALYTLLAFAALALVLS